MGSNNASKSTSAYRICNYFTILRSGTAFEIGDLDVSERQLLLELKRIILIEEILDVIVDLPVFTKAYQDFSGFS